MSIRVPEFIKWKGNIPDKFALVVLRHVLDHLDEYNQNFYPTLRDKVDAEALKSGWSRTHANIIADRAMNL